RSPMPEDAAQREGDEGTDGPAPLLDQIDVGLERMGAGEQVEQRQGPDEGGETTEAEPASAVPRLADDHRQTDAGPGDGKDEGPHAEEEPAPLLDPLPDRSGQVEERQGDEDPEDDEDETPDIIGLAAKRLPQPGPHPGQRPADACEEALPLLGVGLLLLGHPSPPGPLPGGDRKSTRLNSSHV